MNYDEVYGGENAQTGESGGLFCPGCGQDYGLHHHGVKLVARNEDGPGTLVVVEALDQHVPNIRTKADIGPEESVGRRHHLDVYFWCENCAAQQVLRLVQHKGTTYLQWHFPKGTRPEHGSDE